MPLIPLDPIRALSQSLPLAAALAVILPARGGLAAPTAPVPLATEPPVIPIGADAYTQWEHWARLRLGVRAYMRSTFDRTGGNHTADAAHDLRLVSDGQGGRRAVVMDEAGPGILWFVRHNHWHGSPWTYTVDGKSMEVRESTTADPTKPVEGSVFEPRDIFPPGLTWTWSVTKGADLSWVPMPFTDSLTLEYGRSQYGTGYFNLWKIMPGAPLSRPLTSWDRQPPAGEVLQLLARSGSDIAPTGKGVTARAGRVTLGKFETHTVVAFTGGPTTLRRLAFTVAARDADVFLQTRLRIFWDGRPEPSVDAPAGLFFGTASLMRTPGSDHIVKSFPMSVACDARTCTFATYFPMPFQSSARVELSESTGARIGPIAWQTRSEAFAGAANSVGLFHATYRDFPRPERGRDLELLDTSKVEGGGAWCGHFVGTTYLFTRSANLNTLEGDPRFFFDDSLTPQAHGTGSEEWGGGGDYWGGHTMTLPFAGHPVGKPTKEAKTPLEKIHSAYRFLLGDLMPFGRNARITLEHGAVNLHREPYEAVTYWYGIQDACLRLTDSLDVGDGDDEQRHAYRAEGASRRYEFASRHEVGWDVVPFKGVEHGWGQTDSKLLRASAFDPTFDDGRTTAKPVTFALALDPRNLGALLRRRLDLQSPNQKARVLVADPPASPEGKPNWRPAGIWYTAGSNTAVWSHPNGLPKGQYQGHQELAPFAEVLETSNRRWRDDEFMLPRALTEGRDKVLVRIEPIELRLPLVPGRPADDNPWTEFRYWAYSFVMPGLPAAEPEESKP